MSQPDRPVRNRAADTMAASWHPDEPLGITAVAAVIQHNTSGILSRAGDGIDTPAGLTGKTYSTWDSPIELAMLENVVNSDGGDFDQVTLIPNDITDEPAALAAHQTDAIWVFQGWGGVNGEVEGVDCDYFAFSDINPVFDYYTPLLSPATIISAKIRIRRKHLRSNCKGYEFAAENPTSGRDPHRRRQHRFPRTQRGAGKERVEFLSQNTLTMQTAVA